MTYSCCKSKAGAAGASAQKDLSLQPDVPLKILENFEPSDEWVLEPGDMLYLPPHIAHDGVAEGECMTCSIGFRAPSAGELGAQFLYYLAGVAACATVAAMIFTAIRSSRPSTRPPSCLRRWSSAWPRSWTRSAGASGTSPNSRLLLSEPKPNVVFDPPARRCPRPRSSRKRHAVACVSTEGPH